MVRGLDGIHEDNERAHNRAWDDAFDRAVAVADELIAAGFASCEDRPEVIATVQAVILRDMP